MQEGSPAFAMMVSITTAVYRHKDKNLPFLVYLRNPTTGGVLASWGSAGHFTFAEPGALLGFLGPRVVELTTGTPIPEGVQTGENLARHGVIDGVISPSQLRTAVLKIVSVLFPAEKEEQDVDTRVLDTEVNVERSAWESITITRNPERPGLRHLVEALSPNTVALSGTGDGRTSRAVTVMLARIGSRPVVLIGQDRHKQPPLGKHPLGPSALRMARRGIQLAHELQLPLISIIDTPGAELSQHAEENAMAGSIARHGRLHCADTGGACRRRCAHRIHHPRAGLWGWRAGHAAVGSRARGRKRVALPSSPRGRVGNYLSRHLPCATHDGGTTGVRAGACERRNC